MDDNLPDDDPPDSPPLYDGKSSSFSLVPWPGSDFIIRSVSSGQVITLHEGQIKLSAPGTCRGCIHWACVESKGWLGFRNKVSGIFLGHDAKGILYCSAKAHSKWEWFCVRPRPEGGCVLLMTHHDGLWRVGVKEEQGVEKLAKIEDQDGEYDGMVWEFAKV